MKQSDILIVGGEGFIGSRLRKRRPEWESIDLKSGKDVRGGITEDYKVVIVLAAHLGQSEEDYIHNLEIYAALARSFAGREKPTLVYTSSAAVYADVEFPHSEDELPQPSTVYGKSKLLGEEILRDNFSAVILRLSNVYGDGDGKGVVDIFKRGGGEIYGDGEQVRDYIYVERVVDAIVEVAENWTHYAGVTFNISSGEGRTVNQIFETYAIGQPEYLPERTFDVQYSVLDNSRAKREGLL